MASFLIDKYSVQLYANDLRGSMTRWADKVIYLYSGNQLVANAYFAREGTSAPDATFSGGVIYYHAPGSQYAPVIDMLRNEKPVYIAWTPHADSTEPNDGDAYLFTGQEPIGEGE